MRNPISIVGRAIVRGVTAAFDASALAKPDVGLKDEQAGQTSLWVRNPHGGHPAAGLTPERLAMILRSSELVDPELYLELAEDMEERFPQYGSVVSTRKRQVASLEFSVKPGGEDPADIEEAAFIKEIIDSAAFRLSKVDQLDAIAKAFSCVEMIWSTADGKWRPAEFKYRDPRFFKFDQVDPEHLLLRNGGQLDELVPYKWLVHRAKAKSGLTIRSGLARQAAWLFMFSSYNMKDWAIFAEAFGMPYRLGKYDSGASEADKRALLAALQGMGTDGAGIIPLASEIMFIESKITGSTDLYERRATFLDKAISKIVLGQVGTTDEMKGGYALGKVHDDVRDDIKDADAEQWAATLNAQLVKPAIDFNFAMRPRKAYPEICIGRPEEEDVKAWTENVARLIPMGLEVTQDEAQKKIGVTPAAKDQKLLRAPAAAPSPFGPPANDALPSPADKPARATAAFDPSAGDDAIDQAVDETLADQGWLPLVSPIVDGLAEELAKAQSVDEVKQILRRRAQTMGVSNLTDQLARAVFTSRLAGETDEALQ